MTAALAKLSFGSPLWLYGLLLLPALAALVLWAEHQSQRRLERLIQSPRLRAHLTGAASVGRRRWRFALMLAGLGGLIAAMTEPRWGEEILESHRRGLDLVVIADVSKSMLATDIAPNRLTREKLSVQDLAGQLGGDRLGLVAFAGSAFLQAPLTVDYDAVLAAAAELDTDLIPRGGTNIGGAIDLALEAFGKAESGNRAIVLLSDGEPTSDTEQANGVEAAGRAAAAGVKIFTVGIGTTEGSLIPLNVNGTEFVRDEDGKIVRTRLDEDNLRALAKAGNGVYLRFTSGEATMRALVEQGLSKLKTGEIDARLARRPIERYQWPLGAGLLLLGVAGWVGERRKVRAPVAVEADDGRMRPEAKTITGPRAQAVAAVVTLFAGIALGVTPTRAADATVTPPASPAGGALELYRNGRYDDAYRAFEEMAKKHPDQGSLQFNAGASAYMGKQYDEALDAFGHAMTSDNADLQAKSHYNFGNTLYKRGEGQKDREARIKDWKNALQHYDSTLEMLKRSGPNGKLATDATYNRDIVKKRLDEESKQPPPQKQQQKDGKQDKQDKQDQQNQQGQQQNQDQQQGQNKQDQQGQGQDQQNQPPQDQQGQQGQSQQGKNQQPPTPSPTGKSKDDKQNANQPPKPEDGQPSGDQPPDRTSDPNQDKPRQRGDFQSIPGETPNPNGTPPQPADDSAEAKEEAGKMSPAQARALLDSLKGEDDRVQLNGKLDNRKKNDESVLKDW